MDRPFRRGSFRDKANAERAGAALSGIAEVHVEPVEMDGETYYRVLVGPFADGIEGGHSVATRHGCWLWRSENCFEKLGSGLIKLAP